MTSTSDLRKYLQDLDDIQVPKMGRCAKIIPDDKRCKAKNKNGTRCSRAYGVCKPLCDQHYVLFKTQDVREKYKILHKTVETQIKIHKEDVRNLIAINELNEIAETLPKLDE